jgi:hypothetical protein
VRIHFSDIRLFVNAGMRFPACYSGAKLLDTDKSRLSLTTNRDKVTCKHCQKAASAAFMRMLP